MRTAFIINDAEHESLLRFTETKLFFDAKSQSIDFVDDCVIVEDESQIPHDSDIVILTAGDFLTTNFRKENADVKGVIDSRSSDKVIRYSKDIDISYKKRIPYPLDSKHLYIVENMLKVCRRARSLVYLENTEPLNVRQVDQRHFFGLASGWKSMLMACENDFDSVTIFDVNQRQLDYAKMLHSYAELPKSVNIVDNVCGEFDPPDDVRNAWKQWHEMEVNFISLDLFDCPQFPKNSFVWISNVFRYEPNIFHYGWEKCKTSHLNLIENNKETIIATR
jgi:hypothetical protein